jgi:hypothetical protein
MVATNIGNEPKTSMLIQCKTSVPGQWKRFDYKSGKCATDALLALLQRECGIAMVGTVSPIFVVGQDF